MLLMVDFSTTRLFFLKYSISALYRSLFLALYSVQCTRPAPFIVTESDRSLRPPEHLITTRPFTSSPGTKTGLPPPPFSSTISNR